MKALVLEDKNILDLKEVASPEPKADEVLLKIELCSIGGSEYMALANPGIRPLPHIMGHGILGTTSSGARAAVYPLQSCNNCDYCTTGLMQLCDKWTLIGVHSDGGFAQQVVVPKSSIVELPKTLSWEQAVFVEPFANAINAWEIAKTDSKNSIAIVGAGGLGLGLVAAARSSGHTDIAICDPSATRLDVAFKLGASSCLDEQHGQYDVVFETFGSIESRNKAIEITKKGGKCIFMGFASPNLDINISEIIRHQKHLMGTFVYTREHFKKAIQLAEVCSPEWVTKLSFVEVEPVLKSYLNGDFGIVKAALNPN